MDIVKTLRCVALTPTRAEFTADSQKVFVAIAEVAVTEPA